jgi:hypothetical protein
MNEYVAVYQCDEGYKVAHTVNPSKMPGDGRYGTNPKLVLTYSVDNQPSNKGYEVASRMIGYLFSKHKGKAIFDYTREEVENAFDLAMKSLDDKTFFNNL